MTSIILVTCTAFPELNKSEQLYAGALERRGIVTRAAPWNGSIEPFLTRTPIILRSNWDFHHAPAQFLAWLTRIEHHGTPIANAPDLVRWNVDKSYLLDLNARGAATPVSHIVPNQQGAVRQVLEDAGWSRAVVKPTFGASGYEVELVTYEDLSPTSVPLPTVSRSPVMVQEYLPEMAETGELSCAFFGGVFSHALIKRPAPGEFRINSRYGGQTFPTEIPTEVIAQVQHILDLVGEETLYARLDGVLRDGRFVLTELELNEPDFDFHLVPRAAERFADVTCEWLDRQRTETAPHGQRPVVQDTLTRAD